MSSDRARRRDRAERKAARAAEDKPATGLALPEAEPAVVRGIVVGLALLASLGISWAADVDADTITLWALVVGPLIPVAQALWTRYGVTANAKVVARVSTSTGTVVAGDAAAEPTGEQLPVASPAAGAPAGVAVTVRPELVQ